MIELPTLPGRANPVYCYGNILYSRDPTNPSRLQKSLDEGATWVNIYTFAGNIGPIIVCANGNILVAIDADYWADPPAQIYLSTNAGSSFASVKTFVRGGVAEWSLDVKGNEVVLGEYGQYDSKNVYYSSNGGVTWSTIFTQPDPTNGTIHMHAVQFDPYEPNTIYIANGDSYPVRSVWFTRNNGSSWTRITSYHQPTFIVVSQLYIFLFEDLEGMIHRITKADLFAGNFLYKQVYTVTMETEGEFGALSFYSARIDSNGVIYAGGIGYGGGGNDKDGVLLASWDNGDHWRVVKIYPRIPNISVGPGSMSTPTNSGKIFIKTNNPVVVEVLDTTRADLQALFVALPPKPSSVIIKGVISMGRS